MHVRSARTVAVLAWARTFPVRAKCVLPLRNKETACRASSLRTSARTVLVLEQCLLPWASARTVRFFAHTKAPTVKILALRSVRAFRCARCRACTVRVLARSKRPFCNQCSPPTGPLAARRCLRRAHTIPLRALLVACTWKVLELLEARAEWKASPVRSESPHGTGFPLCLAKCWRVQGSHFAILALW